MDLGVMGNLKIWKQLQRCDYFTHHPLYQQGKRDDGDIDVAMFEERQVLNPHGSLAIIGCGYGREAKHFCDKVAMVYGIDVSPKILQQAVRFVNAPNFVPVLAEDYKRVVPNVDYVWSISVFQHMSKKMAADYVRTFKTKIKPGGAMLVQFVEHSERYPDRSRSEPSYSWKLSELEALFGSRAKIASAPFKRAIAHSVYWKQLVMGKIITDRDE